MKGMQLRSHIELGVNVYQSKNDRFAFDINYKDGYSYKKVQELATLLDPKVSFGERSTTTVFDFSLPNNYNDGIVLKTLCFRYYKDGDRLKFIPKV